MNKYFFVGKEITIEEMPQGCVINKDNMHIVICHPDDAKLLIDSLKRLLKSLDKKKVKVENGNKNMRP